jgi:hypothetical protein
VLAGLEREDRVLPVVAVRRGDVDDVDVGVGDELLVRPVRVGDVVVGGERARRLRTARSDRGDGEPAVRRSL